MRIPYINRIQKTRRGDKWRPLEAENDKRLTLGIEPPVPLEMCLFAIEDASALLRTHFYLIEL